MATNHLRQLIMTIDLLCSVSSSSDAELCLRYWARAPNAGWHESLTTISRAFDITLEDLEDRIAINSVAYAPNIRCEHCATPRGVTSRAQFETLQEMGNRLSLPCQRVACELGRRPLELIATAASVGRRADFIGEFLEKLRRDLRPTDYNHLAPLDAYYLYCVLLASGGGGWSDNELPPLVSYSVELAPTRLLADQMFRRLHARNVIVPSVHSSIYAFNIANFECAPITFDMSRVGWTMAEQINYPENYQILEILRCLIKSVSVNDREQLRQVLLEHECLRVLMNCFDKFNIEPNLLLESKLSTVIQNILRNLPISVTISIVRQMFIDTQFCKKLRDAKREGVARVVAEALLKRVDDISFLKLSSNIESSVNDKIFEGSEFVASCLFWELFSQE